MRSHRQLVLVIAVGSAITACRHPSPETATRAPYNLRQCVRRELQREGFRIDAPYPDWLSGTTGAIGPDAWNVEGAMPDGSQVDRVTVRLTGLRIDGRTSVRDRATGGWRQVPSSPRVNRTIENVYKFCPAPVLPADTSAR